MVEMARSKLLIQQMDDQEMHHVFTVLIRARELRTSLNTWSSTMQYTLALFIAASVEAISILMCSLTLAVLKQLSNMKNTGSRLYLSQMKIQHLCSIT